MRVVQDEPFEAQGRANGAMSAVLQRATAVAVVVALLGVVVPGGAGVAVAWGAFVMVVAVPLLRITWLALRWASRRDYAFSLLAATLLAIVAVGGVLALLQG